jgi:hypothetical protein
VACSALALSFALCVAPEARSKEPGAEPVVISGTIVSTHDRLPPDDVTGIIIERQYSITISGKNAVEEHWSSTPLRNARRELHLPVSSTDSQRALGEDGATVAWHVVGPNALQRISQGQQFIIVMRFQFDDRNKTCSLDTRFVEQKGFNSVVMRRADNGQLAKFTLDRVLSTTCTVE